MRACLVALALLLPLAGCEELRVALGARDLAAHYRRCKLLDPDGPLREHEGRISATRAGSGSLRCRQGKALVTLRLTVVEPARLEILGPPRLGGGVGSYHLRALDDRGLPLRVGRVRWEHGTQLEPVPRCPPDLPVCPDFLDSVQLRLAPGASSGLLRACLARCAELRIER
jgi:hypothetical protein